MFICVTARCACGNALVCLQPVADLLKSVAGDDDDYEDGEDEEGDWDDDIVEAVIGRSHVRRVTHTDNVETRSRL